MKGPRLVLFVAAVVGALGVGCGAFGAHALKDRLGAEALAWWSTASHYHLIHALAAALAAVIAMHSRGAGGRAGGLFLLGIGGFSGSLYAMALGAPRFVALITPVGGLLLIAGWLALAVSVLKASSASQEAKT